MNKDIWRTLGAPHGQELSETSLFSSLFARPLVWSVAPRPLLILNSGICLAGEAAIRHFLVEIESR